MANDRSVEIGINTTADTSGVKKMTEAMGVLGATTGTSADKARVFTFASYNLDEALKTGAKNAERNSDAVKVGSTNLGKMGQLANQASYQIGDFFTQVEMGTSVTRAFSQQAPQLIGALSSAGVMSARAAMALTGVGAAIPLITMALPKLIEMLGVTGEKAEKIAIDVDKVAEAMGAFLESDWEAYQQGLENSRKMTDALAQKWDETKDAEQSAALSAIDNSGKVAEAQRVVSEQLGHQVDRYREIEEIAALSAAKRAQEAKDATDAALEREATARDNAGDAGDALLRARADMQSSKLELEALTKKLEILRKQKAELEAIAKETYGVIGSIGEAGVLPWTPTPKASRAQQQLDAPAFQAELEGTDKKVEALTKIIAGLGAEIPKLEIAAEEAATARQDQERATATTLAELKANIEADETSAKAQEISDLSKAQADSVNQILAAVEPTTAAQRTAVDNLARLAADGKIIASESNALASNLQALFGGIQVGVTKINSNTEQLFQLMKETVAKQSALESQFSSFKIKVESLGKK